MMVEEELYKIPILWQILIIPLYYLWRNGYTLLSIIGSERIP